MRISSLLPLVLHLVITQSGDCGGRPHETSVTMSPIVESYSAPVASAYSQSQLSQLATDSAMLLQPSSSAWIGSGNDPEPSSEPSAPPQSSASSHLSASPTPSALSTTKPSLTEVSKGSNFTLRFTAEQSLGPLFVSNFTHDIGSKSFLSLTNTTSKRFYMNHSSLLTRDYEDNDLYGIRLKDPWDGQEGLYSIGAWWRPQESSPPWGSFRVDWSTGSGVLLMEALPYPLSTVAFNSWVACRSPIDSNSTVLVAKFTDAELQDENCKPLGDCKLEA